MSSFLSQNRPEASNLSYLLAPLYSPLFLVLLAQDPDGSEQILIKMGIEPNDNWNSYGKSNHKDILNK